MQRALFGGALMAAGVSAAAQPTWTFESPRVGVGDAINVNGYVELPVYGFVPIEGALPGEYGAQAADGSEGRARVLGNEVSTLIRTGPSAYGTIQIFAYVSVAETTEVEWTVSRGGPNNDSNDNTADLRVFEYLPNANRYDLTLFKTTLQSPVGFQSGVITLEPGVGYQFVMLASSILQQSDTSASFRVVAGCTPADLAAPFGVLDLDDVDAFIAAFLGQDAAADLAPPAGVFDLADTDAFISGFLAGCP